METWERSIGAVVVATITLANYGRWPRSLDDWTSVALRYGLYVNIGPVGTFLCEQEGVRIAFIKATKSRRKLHNHIAHEVAEHLVRTECSAPYQFKENPVSRHRVACFVQQYDRRVRQVQKRGHSRHRDMGCDPVVH